LRRDLFMPSKDLEIIIDDESYFTLDGSDGYGNDHYYHHTGLETPDHVKYQFKSKYPSKVMVWLAMSSRGISQPFIRTSGNAINSQIYIEECIRKGLVKFIEKYHSDNKFVFWPDLASSHYAKAILEELNRLNIKVVPKDSNPPNYPQLRPIERFWTILKRKIYAKGWTAKTSEDLIDKIKSELRKIP
jgi:transposase